MKTSHILILLATVIGLILLLSNLSSIIEMGKIIPATDVPEPTVQFGSGPDNESSLSLASVVSCTPDAGYDYCYENTHNGLITRIMSTTWQGKSGYGYIDGVNRKYYIDEVYVNIKYEGDRLYKSSSTSWTSCSSSGCSANSISPGKQVLITSPSQIIPPVHFTAWNKFTSTSGTWWYSYVSFGWLSSTPTYVIDCYDNSDCQEGCYCDKSGAWYTWSCKVDTCSTIPDPENICDGFNLYSQKCVLGDIVKDQLIETNSTLCGCIIQDPPNICVGYDLWSQQQKIHCVDSGFVKNELIERNSHNCGYICNDLENILYYCPDGSNVIESTCIDNKWIENNYPIRDCTLNTQNIKYILRSYYEEIKNILKFN